MTTETTPAYQQAKERVEELRSFYVATALYIIVNLMLFVIDMLTPGGPWFYWPLLGWGIGMLIFALNVFVLRRRFGQDWEERKIRQYLEEDA